MIGVVLLGWGLVNIAGGRNDFISYALIVTGTLLIILDIKIKIGKK